jgi:hypothetical protein
MWAWLKQFVKDYVPWTLVDLLIYTRTRRVFLLFLAGAVVSGIAFIFSYWHALGPAWQYGPLSTLVATSVVTLGTGALLLIEKR